METKPDKISIVNFDELNLYQLNQVLKTGSLENLPETYQEYYSVLDKVRGIRAKGSYNKKLISKSGIIKLIMNDYKVSDYMARRIFEDSINFFYTQENVKPEAFANLYADQLEEAALLARNTGDFLAFDKLINSAAKLRKCFDKKAPEIPQEFYQKQVIIYTTKAEEVGITPVDMKELERVLDAIPEIPAMKLQRVKADAGINKYNILRNIAEDQEEFIDEENKKD